VAASLLWMLRGDAGQRELSAWSMGWAPARVASGDEWMAPYLAQLLDDPYAAVRYNASRSLRALPGYGDIDFDYAGAAEGWHRAKQLTLARWTHTHPHPAVARPELLLDENGALRKVTIDALLQSRDDRPVALNE
jgi:hypothetical protein